MQDYQTESKSALKEEAATIVFPTNKDSMGNQTFMTGGLTIHKRKEKKHTDLL